MWSWCLFLAHPTHWHERVTSEYAQESTWCWFWVFQVSGKNQSPETILNLHCCAIFPTWQDCLNSHVWWMNEIYRAKRLTQALVHLVIARASLSTDHRLSGLPMRAKYKHCRTIWEHTFWQFSNRSHFFFLELMVIKAWSCDFVQLLSLFVGRFAIFSHAWPSMS